TEERSTEERPTEEHSGESTEPSDPTSTQASDEKPQATPNGKGSVAETTQGDLAQQAVEAAAAQVAAAAASSETNDVGDDSTAAQQNDVPWSSAIAADAPSVDWRDLAMRRFDVKRSMPQVETLKDWFEPVVGHAFEIHPTETRLGRCGQIQVNSIGRLRAPLNDDTTLRMELDHHNRVRIHVYCGTVGVTLAYYEHHQYCWAAYATMRKPKEVLPSHAALTSTDGARARRSEVRYGGPLELRYRDGEVILSRGEIALVRAPLPGPPNDVYFQGQLAFPGLELVRTHGFPAAENPLPLVWESDRPVELEWDKQLAAGAWTETLPDGGMALVASQPKEKSHVTTPLRPDGICLATMELRDVSPGTGVFFQSTNGRRNEILRFVRNPHSGRTCLVLRGNDDAHEHPCRRLEEDVEPCVGQTVWLRMLFGCATWRWWISVDGRHWAESDLGWWNMPGDIASIGVQHVANRENTRIEVHTVQVRRLDALSSLASDELLTRARAAYDLPNLPAWLDAIEPHKPAGVNNMEWRRACAVKTLSVGATRDLSHALLSWLLDDAAERDLPIERQLQLLNEAALIYDVRDDLNLLTQFFGRYHSLGAASLSEGRRPFSTILEPMLTAPVASQQAMRLAEQSLMRGELLQLLDGRRWGEALAFADRLRFLHFDEQFPLVDWAEATARREISTAGHLTAEEDAASLDVPVTTVTRLKEDWQHPYVETLNKSTYNMLHELQALLDSGANEDAAKLLTAIEPGSWDGVAPAPSDSRLLVSLPTALRTALRENSELREIVRAEYATLARLRIRQAIQRGDPEAVRLAAVQFEPTDVVAEAYRWLGDRALDSGWFGQAQAWYELERDADLAGNASGVHARLRLVAALQGRTLGEAVTAPVAFGDALMAPAEFEAMIADLVTHRSAASDGGEAHSDSRPSTQVERIPLQDVDALQVNVRGRLEGQLGEDPRREMTRHVRTHAIDWPGRQMATLLDGDTLFVSNRFQLAAYDSQSGQRRWTTPAPPNRKMQFAQAWTNIAMRPTPRGDSLFVRMLYGEQPCLTCVNRADGTFRWVSELPDSEAIVSDPLWLHNQLVVLTAERSDQQATVLRISRLDSATGEVVDRLPLAYLRDSWWQRRNASVTQLKDGL
ncbi:MAG: PQQ-binding-like beta-propeller repeat protein, partial [Planctomycetales bacterium]|nr:PQQ-binding-like beta-propeller repeat protein [Planctomycetales bacterium]